MILMVCWTRLNPPVPVALSSNSAKLRKSVVSIKFPPAILGRKWLAPILWAPGIFWFFLLENPHAHKIPPFRGGGVVGFLEGGGWKCRSYFYGRGDFSDKHPFSTRSPHHFVSVRFCAFSRVLRWAPYVFHAKAASSSCKVMTRHSTQPYQCPPQVNAA